MRSLCLHLYKAIRASVRLSTSISILMTRKTVMRQSKKQSGWNSAIRVIRMSSLLVAALGAQSVAFASEAELHIPPLNTTYNLFGATVAGSTLLGWGMVVAFLGMIFGFVEFLRVKKMPVHNSMAEVSHL